jgi:tetratricopeptide (TPR) repeat protein
MTRRAVLLLAALALPVSAWANESPPMRPSAPVTTPAEEEYGKGIRAKRAKEWSVAAASFQKAVELKPGYPEAWNELGYAYRQLGKYPESASSPASPRRSSTWARPT